MKLGIWLIKVIGAVLGHNINDESNEDEAVFIDHATFSKERIKKIEDSWVRDGLIR